MYYFINWSFHFFIVLESIWSWILACHPLQYFPELFVHSDYIPFSFISYNGVRADPGQIVLLDIAVKVLIIKVLVKRDMLIIILLILPTSFLLICTSIWLDPLVLLIHIIVEGFICIFLVDNLKLSVLWLLKVWVGFKVFEHVFLYVPLHELTDAFHIRIVFHYLNRRRLVGCWLLFYFCCLD